MKIEILFKDNQVSLRAEGRIKIGGQEIIFIPEVPENFSPEEENKVMPEEEIISGIVFQAEPPPVRKRGKGKNNKNRIPDIKKKILDFLREKGGSGTIHCSANKDSSDTAKKEFKKLYNEVSKDRACIRKAIRELMDEKKIMKSRIKAYHGACGYANIYTLSGVVAPDGEAVVTEEENIIPEPPEEIPEKIHRGKKIPLKERFKIKVLPGPEDRDAIKFPPECYVPEKRKASRKNIWGRDNRMNKAYLKALPPPEASHDYFELLESRTCPACSSSLQFHEIQGEESLVNPLIDPDFAKEYLSCLVCGRDFYRPEPEQVPDGPEDESREPQEEDPDLYNKEVPEDAVLPMV